MATMNNPNPDPNQQQKENIIKHLLEEGKDHLADFKFVDALLTLGINISERLKKNAYMLSTMAKVGGSNNDNTDRYVALLVKKLKHNKYRMLDPNKIDKIGGSTELVDNLGNKITERNYNSYWNLIANVDSSVNPANHKYLAAKQYLRVWANFITWSCNFEFSTQKMTLEEVNMLVAKTEEKIIPLFREVKNGQNRELGVRNFISHHKKFSAGTVHQKLDQLMIEYRHEMVGKANATDNGEYFIVIGIPGRFNDSKKEGKTLTQKKFQE